MVRLSELISSFAHRLARGQNPIHRAFRAKVLPFVQKRRDDLGRGAVDEARRGKRLEDVFSFALAQGPGRRGTGLLAPGSEPVTAVEGCPRYAQRPARRRHADLQCERLGRHQQSFALFRFSPSSPDIFHCNGSRGMVERAGEGQGRNGRDRVARAGESASIDKRFCDQDRVAVQCVGIAREPAKAQPQHPRSEVRRGVPGQDEEPRVVGNQVKAAKLLLRQPPDPAVTGLELERAGVPAHEREPQLAEHCDVAHASPDQAPEGQIVVRAHQRIPADPLVGAHRGADRDLAQPSGNQLEHRLRRGRWACAPLWRPRRRLFRDPVSLVASISYRARKNWPCPAYRHMLDGDGSGVFCE